MPTVVFIKVRATVHLSGLKPGQEVRVDPDDPYINALLERGYLQRVEEDA